MEVRTRMVARNTQSRSSGVSESKIEVAAGMTGPLVALFLPLCFSP